MMTERTLRVLEFPRVRDMLAEGALTVMGAEKCRTLVPFDTLFDIEQAASMTECTGILPFQIQTEEEGESVSALESIHPIQPPAGKHKAK